MSETKIFWGESARMNELLRDISHVAPTTATVLLTGPSGSGKEVFARHIHKLSGVKGEFLAINCAAIPENLLESLLFGHERGVFTGAFDRQIGLFERAAGGTLFLDEIGCMPEFLQAKLLRVLQDMEFQRLGSHLKIKLAARLLAATNENLERCIAEGRFRADLYYRLAVFPLSVPSLKSRLVEIPSLFRYFVELYKERYQRPEIRLDRSLPVLLKNYDWPGNIRELKNAAEYVVLKCEGDEVLIQHLPPQIVKHLEKNAGASEVTDAMETVAPHVLKKGFEIPVGGIRVLMRSFEREVIIDILKRHGGILNRAYKELGIPKPTLIQRARMLNIDVNKIKYEASL